MIDLDLAYPARTGARLTATWEFNPRQAGPCGNCGAPRIPHIPSCRVCGATLRPVFIDRADAPMALDEKPANTTRVAHLSDLHIGAPTTHGLPPMAVFRMWIEAFARASVDVIVVSGDLVERPGDVYGMQRARSVLDDCGMSWVVVPGNHDIRLPGYPDVFNQVFGTFPRVEVHGGIAFILFDTMAGLPMELRELTERLYGDYVCYTEGRVGAEQMERADALLKGVYGHRRQVVLHHHIMRQHADLLPRVPKQIGVTEDVLGTMKALLDAEEFLSWCRHHKVELVYHGHKHVFQPPGMRGGPILVLNGGSSTLDSANQRARLLDHLPDGRTLLSNVELLL